MEKTRRTIRIGKRAIDLSSEDKILFPKAKITKGEFIAYYQQIAPCMIPFMKSRPVTLHRFPDGIKGEGFYQKEASGYFPEWIDRIAVKNKTEGATHYVMCDDVATVVYLANQGTLEFHLWLSKAKKLNYPDHMIFDLDPSRGVTFAMVRWVAKKIKELLEALGLPTYVMLTGSRGVHIWVPLKAAQTYEYVHAFAYDVAQLVTLLYPEKTTIEMSKAKRGKRIFIDYLRNTFGQTGVAPYSVRPNEKAAVATPIGWHELFVASSDPQKYTIKNMHKRLSRVKDPWADMPKHACSLTAARKKLSQMIEDAQQNE